MTRRSNRLLLLLFLALGIALAPMACGSDNGNDDASVDSMTPS
jgi:hypothetical protein